MTDYRAVAVRLGTALVAVCGFLVAVRSLGTATGALAPQLRTLFARVIDTNSAALGGGWLAAYLLFNGSVVAVVALTLFGAQLVTTGQLLLLVAGSRLGAAGVVLLVGGVDYLRHRAGTARESMRLGTLSFLVTYSVYLPATLLSYFLLPSVQRGVLGARTTELSGAPPSAGGPLFAWLLDTLGAAGLFVFAIGLLAGSLSLLDRLFGATDTAVLRQRYLVRLQRPVTSFLAGVVLTALTTSVAFSLGVLVPLYNRGLVTRRETLPFVLGASVGTLSDTLLAAVVVGTPGAVTTVLVLLTVGTVLSLIALAGFEPYADAIGRLQDRILADRAVFLGFVASLLAVPLALLAL